MLNISGSEGWAIDLKSLNAYEGEYIEGLESAWREFYYWRRIRKNTYDLVLEEGSAAFRDGFFDYDPDKLKKYIMKESGFELDYYTVEILEKKDWVFGEGFLESTIEDYKHLSALWT